MERMTSDLAARVISRVRVDETTGCWLWQGSKNGRGYGSIWDGNRLVRTHRVTFEDRFGEIAPGKVILHACDNPPCCNPDHLVAGNQTENLRDMVAKGRSSGKLQPEQVVEIRGRLAAGEMQRDLASEFGVCQQTISNIKTGKRWSVI